MVWSVLAAGALLGFWQVADRVALPLELGSNFRPTESHAALMRVWLGFGTVATAAAALALAPWLERWDRLSAGSLRAWLLAGSAVALLTAVLVRLFVFEGAAISDDEAAYGFAARLLSRGELWVDSHPEKLFFDRWLYINDGRFYTVYFLGWPALLVPGVVAGVGAAVNALYHALTYPAVHLLARELGGERAGRFAGLLFLVSPFAAFMSGTGLSHTTCLCAGTWAAYALVRSGAGGPRAAAWAALGGLLVSMTFFIRPLTAVGLLTVFVLHWVVRTLRSGRPLPTLGAFALPSGAMGALFLAVNQAQNGAWSRTAYQAMVEYSAANGHRFSPLDMLDAALFTTSVPEALSQTWVGIVRFSHDVFMWPIGIVLLPIGLLDRRCRLPLAAFAVFVLAHVTMVDGGIDTFGPVHFFELLLPTVLVSALVLDRWSERVAAASRPWVRGLPIAFVIGSAAVSAGGYGLVRAEALAKVAETVAYPEQYVRHPRYDESIIFTAATWAPAVCNDAPGHFRYYAPANLPDLSGRIVWANHLRIAEDRAFARRYFPDRRAYLFWWHECVLYVAPLSDPRLDTFPDSPELSGVPL